MVDFIVMLGRTQKLFWIEIQAKTVTVNQKIGQYFEGFLCTYNFSPQKTQHQTSKKIPIVRPNTTLWVPK